MALRFNRFLVPILGALSILRAACPIYARAHASESPPDRALDGKKGEDDDDDDDEDEDQESANDGGPPSDRDDGRHEAEREPHPSTLTAGADLEIVSRHVWRGMALSQGPAVAPEGWVTYQDLTASAWSDVLLSAETGRRRVSSAEIDLAYKVSWERLRVEPHLTKYWFLNAGVPTETTTEGGASLLLRFGAFSVTSTHDFDIERTKGAYFGTLGGRLHRKIGRWEGEVVFDVGWATASFNRAHWDHDVAGFDLLESAAEARYCFTPLLSAAVHVGVSTLLSPELRRGTSEPTLLTGGVVVSVNH